MLTEASYLLLQSDRRGLNVLLGMILDGHLSIVDLTAEDVTYMRSLMLKYDTMDLADASLVAVGERLDILDIVTIDRRDFSRYRTRTRKAFTS